MEKIVRISPENTKEAQALENTLRIFARIIARACIKEIASDAQALNELIKEGLIKPTQKANFVMQHADNGYTTNLPLEVVMQDNFLLATHYDGQPLTPEHGYPLRAVIGAIPEKAGLQDVYLWKGAKWLRGLEFMAADQLGFWEANGYHNGADVWKEQRRSE